MKYFLYIICLTASFISCSHTSSKKDNNPNSSLGFRILYSSNINGEIAPCGCRSNPLGGVHRRLNWLNSLSKEIESLSLDSGDTFLPTANPPEYLLPQYIVQAKNLVTAYNTLGVQFFTPGEIDLSAGLNTFQSIVKNANFKIINSNIVFKNSEDLVFQPYAIQIIANKKVGIFGLFNPEFNLPPELSAVPLVETAEKIVSKLKSQNVNYIILLSHSGTLQDELLAQKVSGIDFIFSSHSMNFLTNPIRINQTNIFEASLRGEHIGIYDGVSNQLFNMSEDLDSKDSNLNSLDKLIEKNKTQIAEVNKKIDHVLLSDNNATPKIKTVQSCKQCHQEQFQFHLNQRHSKAYETLVHKNQSQNLECLQCHTLGLNQNGGYKNLSQFKNEFKNVQCEHCHSPGGHNPIQSLTVTTCLNCHTLQRSASWYNENKPNYNIIFEKYRLMTCPKVR